MKTKLTVSILVLAFVGLSLGARIYWESFHPPEKWNIVTTGMKLDRVDPALGEYDKMKRELTGWVIYSEDYLIGQWQLVISVDSDETILTRIQRYRVL
jgi:hypothetical protein